MGTKDVPTLLVGEKNAGTTKRRHHPAAGGHAVRVVRGARAALAGPGRLRQWPTHSHIHSAKTNSICGRDGAM